MGLKPQALNCFLRVVDNVVAETKVKSIDSRVARIVGGQSLGRISVIQSAVDFPRFIQTKADHSAEQVVFTDPLALQSFMLKTRLDLHPIMSQDKGTNGFARASGANCGMGLA